MADYSCEWCDKDKTCPYAYNSTSCEQKKYDDFKNIPSEIIDLLNKTKSEMTKLKDKRRSFRRRIRICYFLY